MLPPLRAGRRATTLCGSIRAPGASSASWSWNNFADLGTLSRQVRVTPHTIQGRPSGFRLTRLRPGLLQQIGLLNGDVLQRVNGLDINSPEEALKAYQAVQNEPTVRLEILRRNSPTTLTYEIR